MFTDKIEAQDFHKMPKEYQDLLVRVLRIQADCEIGGPQMYARQWLLDAPTADDMWRMTRVAAEEIDHFRKFNRLLNELGYDASDRLRTFGQAKYVDAFRQQMLGWAEVAVFGFLIDRVGLYQLEEFVDASYLPLARILPPYDSAIVDEERGHINYGTMKLMELCRSQEGKEEAQRALNKWYPIALDMFGQSNSPRNERYLYWGLKRRRNEEARAQYMAEVNPLIERMGLKVPDPLEGRKYL